MAKIPLISSGIASIGAGATNFFVPVNGQLSGNSTETNRTITLEVAGVYSRMYVVISANATSAASTVRFRKNSADGNQTFTIGSGLTGEFEDDPLNSDSISTGQTVSVSITAGTGGTLTVRVLSLLFASNVQTSTLMGSVGLTNISTADIADTQFLSIVGGKAASEGNATEAFAQARINVSGTLRNLYVRINSNARTTTTVLKLRKNGVTGNQALSIGSGVTGFIQDEVNEDTVVAGDLICLCYTTGAGTETLATQAFVVELQTTDQSFIQGAIGDGPSLTVTDGATNYFNFGGATATTTEADYRADVNIPLNVSRLWIYVSANATTSPSTIAIRKNGNNGNQIISVGAGQTGMFECSAAVDFFDSADEISLAVVNGGGGSITLDALTAKFTQHTVPVIKRGMIVVPIAR